MDMIVVFGNRRTNRRRNQGAKQAVQAADAHDVVNAERSCNRDGNGEDDCSTDETEEQVPHPFRIAKIVALGVT